MTSIALDYLRVEMLCILMALSYSFGKFNLTGYLARAGVLGRMNEEKMIHFLFFLLSIIKSHHSPGCCAAYQSSFFYNMNILKI